MNSECAIVILSCDKYADLWEPFFQLFWKNWNDCPYRVYLGSNSISYNHSFVTTILCKDDKDWSSMCRNIIDQVPYENILVWLEDLFIIEQVDTKRFSSVLRYMKFANAKHIHMKPLPTPDHMARYGYGVYSKKMPYRVNVAGLWNKNYLRNLLIDGESPWNFEIMGSYRASYDDGFFCADPPLINWMNAVEKGFWFPDAVKYCGANNVFINTSRPIMTSKDQIKSKIKMLYFNFISKIPWNIRIRIMNMLRKALITY